jgi:CRISP-associated protein Cas1
MLKKTLLISNPCQLTLKDGQMIVKMKEEGGIKSVPCEDIGFIVLDNMQINISLPLIEILNENNAAIVFCNSRHHPVSMILNLDGHNTQNELFRNQINASEPLRKNLWKQTIEAKIFNQAALLKMYGLDFQDLRVYAGNVKSDDATNMEGAAARVYWQRLFGKDFRRERGGSNPNSLLNYGYIVLRAAVARSLIGSGMLPTLGIHHHNRYNAYCLADDIMEPFRPFLDNIVIELYKNFYDYKEITKEIKIELLKVLTVDIEYSNTCRPLMVGLTQTTASLARCFCGESKKIEYPLFN